MTQRKLSLNLGQHDSQVVIGGGSGMTAGLELQINDALLSKKEDAVVLLTELANRIQKEPWPPSPVLGAGAEFVMTQLAEPLRVYQRSTDTGGTDNKGTGTIPVTINVSKPGSLIARLRASDGATVLATLSATTVSSAGQQVVNITDVPAGARWMYLDLSADGVTYQNGTTLVGMGRLVSISGQSQAVRCFGMLSPAVTTITQMGLTIPDFGSVFATYVDDQKTVATPAWAKPATGTNYDSPFLPVFLEREIALHGVNVGVIGHAVGATMVSQWQPGGTNNNKYLSTFAAAGGGCEALYWHLGGTDTANGTPAATYKTGLVAILDSYAAANVIRGSSYPEVLTSTANRLTGSNSTTANVMAIHKATKEVAATRAKGFYSEPHDISLAGDNVHQDSPGDVSLARAVHRAFNAQRAGLAEAGPIITSATRASNSLDIILSVSGKSGGGALALTGSPKTRFVVMPSGQQPVLDGTGALATSGLAVSGNNLVLTLSADPGNTAAVDVYAFPHPDPVANGFADMIRDSYTADGISYGRQLEPTVTAPISVAAPGGGTVTPGDPAVGDVIQMNVFNSNVDSGTPASAGAGWNDLDQSLYPASTPKTLVNSSGATTNAKASITNATTKSSVQDTTSYPAVVSKAVADTYIYMDKANTLGNGASSLGKVDITALVDSAVYTVQVFALRVNVATRLENISVNGGTVQSPNVGTSGTPSSWTATFTGVSPVSGLISVQATQNGSENYAYIGAVKLTRTA